MYTKHFPAHNLLFSGNYRAVFLSRKNIFSFAGSGILMGSITKLASRKAYLLRELTSYPDPLLTYPSSMIPSHTSKSPWRNASPGPGCLGLLRVAKDEINHISSDWCARPDSSQRVLLTKFAYKAGVKVRPVVASPERSLRRNPGRGDGLLTNNLASNLSPNPTALPTPPHA